MHSDHDHFESVDETGIGLMRWVFISLFVALALFAVGSCQKANAVEINMDAIKQIESSCNPRAYNRRTLARGLYQITPIVVDEWNQFHSVKYTPSDLFNPSVNFKIADWYMNNRIPSMFRYFKIDDTVNNRIIAWNAGIRYARNGFAPKETINFISKYERITERNKNGKR